METTLKRVSSCLPAAALLGAAALTLPLSPLRAQGEAAPPTTQAGAYTVGIEESRVRGGAFAANPAFGGFGANGGQAVQSNTGIGLRIQSATREDQMRLMGLGSPLTATDEQGRKVEVVGALGPIPTAFGPARSSNQRYQVRLFVPEGRARVLKTLEGELLVTESRVQRLEFTGKELAQGAEKKIGDHLLKLEPVKTTDKSAVVQLSIKAALEGERAVTQRPGQPQVIVELIDTHDHSYEPRAVMFSGFGGGQAKGLGAGGHFGGGWFGGAFGGGLGGAAFPPGGLGFAPRQLQPQIGGGPLNARFNSSFQTRYEFPPIDNDEEIKSVVCHVLIPTGEPKHVPFRLTDVPLPALPAEAQKQP